VDGTLPADSLRLTRGDAEYRLPKTPENGKLYKVLIKPSNKRVGLISKTPLIDQIVISYV